MLQMDMRQFVQGVLSARNARGVSTGNTKPSTKTEMHDAYGQNCYTGNFWKKKCNEQFSLSQDINIGK
jgi:hypothetical protein